MTREHGGCPGKLSVGYSYVLRYIKGRPINNSTDDGLLTSTLHFHLPCFAQVKGSLHSLRIMFVVHDRGLIDVSLAKAPTARINNEEILQRLTAVVVAGEVGQVIAKLHGFRMHLAIGPLSQHRSLWSWIGFATMSVTGIAEVVHVDYAFRLCRIQVGTDTHLQLHLTAARIVHLQLYGAQWTIVLASMIEFACPPSIELTIRCKGWASMGIGTIDETVVAPTAP